MNKKETELFKGMEQIAEAQRKSNALTIELAQNSYRCARRETTNLGLTYILAMLVVLIAEALTFRFSQQLWVDVFTLVVAALITVLLGRMLIFKLDRAEEHYFEELDKLKQTMDEGIEETLAEKRKKMEVIINQEKTKSEEVKVKRKPGRPRKETK